MAMFKSLNNMYGSNQNAGFAEYSVTPANAPAYPQLMPQQNPMMNQQPSTCCNTADAVLIMLANNALQAARTNASVVTLKQYLDELWNKYTEYVEATGIRLTEVEQAATAVKQRVDTLEATVTDHGQRLGAAETAIGQHTQMIGGLNNGYTAIREDIGKLYQKHDGSSKRMTKLISQVKSLEQQVSSQKKQIADMQKQLTEQDKEQKSLRANQKVQSKQISQNRKKIDGMAKDNAAIMAAMKKNGLL